MSDYFDLSQRDVGAGVAAGGSAFLAAVLFLLWNIVRGISPLRSPLLLLAMLLTPVVALSVATAVWRVAMPDDPKPVYGALAGAVAAAISVAIFAALIGLLATITESSADTLGGLVSEFPSFVAFFVVYGGLVTLPIVVPIGAAVGYGYERYVARGQT